MRSFVVVVRAEEADEKADESGRSARWQRVHARVDEGVETCGGQCAQRVPPQIAEGGVAPGRELQQFN